jgi:hypothetical protein
MAGIPQRQSFISWHGFGDCICWPAFFPRWNMNLPKNSQKRLIFRIISLTIARHRFTLPLDVGHQVMWTTLTERNIE